MRVLKQFWRSLTFLGTLLGLLYLANDIADVPQAISEWRQALGWLNSTIALAIFAALAMIYIILIDARPLITKWIESRKRGLTISQEPSWHSGPGREFNGVWCCPNVCCLVVSNTGSQTIREVRVRAGTFEIRECVDRITGSKQVELHSGEFAEFELGRMVSTRWFGFTDPTIEMNAMDLFQAEHNVPKGHQSLDIGNTCMPLVFPGLPRASDEFPLSIFRIAVSAKDQSPIHVRLVVNASRIATDASDAGNPIRVEILQS